jgi:protoheme IX farnesyltransferase
MSRAGLHLHALADLTKLRIAALSTLSAATGYLVFSRALNPGLLTASSGVLLLAAGACALNQFQDREIDSRMERTRHRPIPAGAVNPAVALAIAVVLIIGGCLVLWFAHGPAPALLGLCAVGCYNAGYTYLKRVSAFAAVPGALTGALPPAIGWTAAGGSPVDPHILALCFFFFIWQVPHFWLLLFAHGPDYQKAGLPSLTSLFSARQLSSLIFIWMLTAFSSSLLLSIYRLTISPWINFGLLACGLWLAWKGAGLVRGNYRTAYASPAFRSINLYVLSVMALLVLDAML